MTVKQRKKKARRVYRACKTMTKMNRPYVYGGGHKPWRFWRAHEGVDCSASVCRVLDKTGIINIDMPATSGAMMSWFEPGPGRWVTMYASPEHVWLKFRGLGIYVRFDTSPWGWGRPGPRLRMGWRSTAGFVARHPKGL
jgi:hypothetical protein